MSEEKKKYIHAELVKQFAEDCFETDKPWERWQYESGGCWINCTMNPSFMPDWEYRRKPRTITINNFVIPEPLREAPEIGTACYAVLLCNIELYFGFMWGGSELDRELLARGIIHLTKENVTIHSKALLSFTEQKAEK